MFFEKKDFEQLHVQKVRNGVTPDEMIRNYFFCLGNKFIAINKSRNFYRVIASASCGFEPMYRETVFDVLFGTKDQKEAIDAFKGYILRLI